MDDQISGSSKARRRPPDAWQHDWYSYEKYLSLQDGYLRQLEDEGTIVNNQLTTLEIPNRPNLETVNITGRIVCAQSVLIAVDKWLEARRNEGGHIEVKGYSYTYHAWISGEPAIVRYDSSHGIDDIHRHYVDPSTGKDYPEPIPLSDLPTLNEFILEALALRALWR